MSRFLGIIIFCVVFITPSKGAIEHFSIEDGLSQSSITNILIDYDGFLWIGTQDGLNRFDGYEFISFTHQPFDTNSIVNNLIKDMAIDSKGNIWVLTNEGICQFLNDQGRFTQNEYNQFNEVLNHSENLYSLVIDKNGIIWVRGLNALYYINPVTRDVNEYILEDFAPQSDYGIDYYPITLNSNDNLLFVVDNELLETNGDEIWTVHDFSNGNANEYIKDIYVYTDSLIYILFEQNVYQLSNNTVRKLNDNGYDWGSTEFSFIDENTTDKLLLGTSSGLFEINIETNSITGPKKIQYYGNNFTYDSFLSSKIDQYGIIWIGTSKGLIKYNKTNEKFNLISKSFDRYSDLISDDIASIYIDDFNNLWLGTWGSGLQILNPQMQLTKVFKGSASNGSKRISNDFVHVLYENKRGDLLIGTRNGIDIYDFTRKKLVRFSEKYKMPGSLFESNRVYHFLESSNYLYIATYKGLYIYDYQSSEYIKMPLQETNPPIIYSLKSDKDNNIWVGTNFGIFILNDKNEVVMRLSHSKLKEIRELSSNDIYSLHCDKEGNMWIGTNLGLNYYNAEKKQLKVYTERDGLPNNLIYAILEDENGDIWFSTNKGISNFKKSPEEFINFDLSEGIQDFEFNLGASFISDKGTIYFGGINGLNYFHPDSIKPELYFPNIAITGLEYTNQDRFKQSLGTDSIITLKYPYTYLKVSFASLDFRDPYKNKYRYSFGPIGDEKNFVSLKTDNYITFSSLTPGEYELIIEGTNSDGVWSNKRAKLKVDVTSTIWNSKFATIFYIIVIIILLYVTFLYRTKSLRKLNREYKERERINEQIARQKEELTIQNKNIRDSINYAKRIQEAMMPSKESFKKLMPTSFILHKPKDIVSGDFYWINEYKDKIFVAAVDCTGHGVPGAFMSIIGYELFRRITNVEGVAKPAEILNSLNENFQDLFKDVSNITLKDGMDIAFCVIDKENRKLEFSGAFNPLYLIRDNKIEETKGDRFSIGLDDEIFPDHDFTNHSMDLMEGDVVYIFSDGYADQFGGPDGKKFKYRRFRHLLLTIHKLPMETQADILDKTIEEWRGDDQEQVDDILIIGMKPL